MYYIKRIERIDLYNLCNKYGLFTCGSNAQYEKVFEIAEKRVTKKELGIMLYLCSEQSLNEIMDIIHPLFKDDTIYS